MKAVPLSIYNEAEERIGRNAPPDRLQAGRPGHGRPARGAGNAGRSEEPDNEHRATAVVGGGGPTITLRTSRGDLVVKTVKD